MQALSHAIKQLLEAARPGTVEICSSPSVECVFMETSGFRHQGYLYNGSPSQHVRLMAPVVKTKLEQNHRCFYLNSEPMVAEFRAQLALIGVDVTRETAKHSLVLSSHLDHLREDQTFDADRMIVMLKEALRQAMQDGYAGLWATGDVAWELGPKPDYEHLAEYEARLEEFVCAHPEMSGICQYHGGVLPQSAMRAGHVMHPSFFINETHSRLNLDYGVASTESLFDLSLPHATHRQASALADSLGITLNEFIKRAIAEKLSFADRKNLKN
jgi:predicted HicB family RNase H-like nuclease